ncbi:hypothetical protein TIFTF001_037688 [Ficus carica]|uniref:Uncharacterized protein n=1 Tax=Ficus carica TaxID=3494 RepID=A0AA88E6G9_FICCA|nr:hypothetical protein TIFTF001_037688 [Ficus carica]
MNQEQCGIERFSVAPSLDDHEVQRSFLRLRLWTFRQGLGSMLLQDLSLKSLGYWEN